MKAWALPIALLLSLGFNLGLLVSVWGAGDDRRGALEQQADGPDGAPEPAPDRPAGGGGSEVRLLEPADPRGAIEGRRLADRLGLRGERRTRFIALQAELRATMRTLGPRLLVLRRQVSRELVFAQPDRERIDRLIDQMARTQAELDRALARTVLESRELLGPRQEAQFRRALARRLRDWQPVAERSAPAARP